MNGKLIWIAVYAAVAVLIPQPGFAQLDARVTAGDAETEYSIFYSPPDRVDALFDSVMDAMPAQNLKEAEALWPVDENGMPQFNRIRPDEDRVVALEAEFGDMPEYWQLRYKISGGYSYERLWMLDKAVKLAPGDPLSLYCLGCEGYTAAERRERASLDEWRVGESEVAALQQEAVDRIYAAAELGADNAFYSYEAAFYLHLAGAQPGRILGLLAKGNAAPVNEWAVMFPAGYVVHQMRAVRERYAEDERYALALPWVINLTLPRFIERRKTVADLLDFAAETEDKDALNTLHRFACRYADQGHCTLVQSIVGIHMVSTIAQKAQEMGIGNGDPAAMRGFSWLHRLAGFVQGRISGATLVWKRRAFAEIELDADDEAGVWEQPFWDNAARLWDMKLMEQETLHLDSHSYFGSLLKFDYNDPGAFAPPKRSK